MPALPGRGSAHIARRSGARLAPCRNRRPEYGAHARTRGNAPVPASAARRRLTVRGAAPGAARYPRASGFAPPARDRDAFADRYVAMTVCAVARAVAAVDGRHAVRQSAGQTPASRRGWRRSPGRAPLPLLRRTVRCNGRRWIRSAQGARCILPRNQAALAPAATIQRPKRCPTCYLPLISLNKSAERAIPRRSTAFVCLHTSSNENDNNIYYHFQ